ncbi:MAG: prolipoprotein diacylglyceryl transferase [Desulfobacterales bacterium]|nr:prolipoprotein diacylglyceryl transferase [Desulfobacterales bacterium]
MERFLHWWQHIPQHLDPVILQIGSFRIQYYGLMYLVAFAVTYLLVRHRLKTEDRFDITPGQAVDLMTAMILGVIVGGRIGYVLFYNLGYYLRHPLEIILPFRFENGITFTGISGMSFHGGLAAVILFSWIYTKKARIDFYQAADLFVPAIPLGYTFGRIGNFINGELYGRVTELPVGMIFPLAPDPRLRHPSQLYEAFFEGIFLFAVLWSVRKRPMPAGATLCLYLIGYGGVRFFIEFARQPDQHLGLVFAGLSMGQLLCLGMIVFGIGLYRFLRHRPQGR